MLNIQSLAKTKGIRLSEIIRESGLSASVVRRHYFSSSTGLERDRGTLQYINLPALYKISSVLGVTVQELFTQ